MFSLVLSGLFPCLSDGLCCRFAAVFSDPAQGQTNRVDYGGLLCLCQRTHWTVRRELKTLPPRWTIFFFVFLSSPGDGPYPLSLSLFLFAFLPVFSLLSSPSPLPLLISVHLSLPSPSSSGGFFALQQTPSAKNIHSDSWLCEIIHFLCGQQNNNNNNHKTKKIKRCMSIDAMELYC